MGVFDFVEEVGGAIVDGAEGAWDAVTGAAEDAANAAAEAAEDAWNALTEAAEDAAKAAAEAAEDAARAAAKAAEDAARALENAVNDTYDWGRGAADTVASGVADAAEWGIGAFETVGKAFVEDIDWEEVGTEFAEGVGEFANAFFGGEDPEKLEDKSLAYDRDDPYLDQNPGGDFGPPDDLGGESDVESIGTIGQPLGVASDGGSAAKQDPYDSIVTTLDEARSHTGFGGVPQVEGVVADASGSVALDSFLIRDQAFSPLGDANDAGIIVVGGYEGPGAAFADAYSGAAAQSVVGGIAHEHRELARETLDGVELPNRELPQLSDGSPFELPGNLGELCGRGPGLPAGGFGGDLGAIFGNGPGGLGDGFGGLGGLFGNGPGGLGDGFGGLGGLFGNGPGGLGDGFGGLGGLFGNGPGGLGDGLGGDLSGLFGNGPGGGFGGEGGGVGDLGGYGLPNDMTGSKMPDIRMPGEDVALHESGGRVYADEGEILQVSHNDGQTWKDVGSSGHEKHAGDTFANQKGEMWYVNADGKLDKVNTSNGGGSEPAPQPAEPTPAPEPDPKDPKNGMPADDGSGGGPNWSASAMPADDGSGGGPNWSPYAMPADDGSGGGPNWSYAMPADDSVGGGGPSWSLHDSAAVAEVADAQPVTSGHQFATAFSAIEPHFSLDGVSALGSHMWF
ncbi:MAG TPA: hypothetical protein VFR60_04130 [Sphingomicrobium sp.]|nr:hypothetical protein [Sphingomicrobium sp.]